MMGKVAWRSVDELAEEARRNAVEAVESKADRALTESMWSQLPDAPLTGSEQSQWREYRRRLREVKGEARGKDRAEEVAAIEIPSPPE